MVARRLLGTRCSKCGVCPREDPTITLHRFPFPSPQKVLRSKVWAMYCFPGKEWTNQSLQELHAQHKVLCGRHFDNTAFTSSKREKLNKFAIPVGMKDILTQLREEQRVARETEQKLCDDLDMTVDDEVEVRTEVSEISHSILKIHEEPESSLEPIYLEIPDEDDTELEDKAEVLNSILQENQKVLPNAERSQNEDHSKESTKRQSVWKYLSIKDVELPHRKFKMFMRCRKYLLEIIRLRKNLKAIKKRDRSILTVLASNKAVDKLIKSGLSSSSYLLLQSLFENVPRKLVGPKETLDDQVLALRIYQRSRLTYHLLGRLFYLPNVRSLKVLLNKIPFVCGINENDMDNLKKITRLRDIKENICLLAFGEMSIRAHRSKTGREDDNNGTQELLLVTHLQTFMAIGVTSNWKQPIVFHFSNGTATAERLLTLLMESLRACFASGLQVFGVICEMNSVNSSVLNTLGTTPDRPCFSFDGHEIVTILDPSHLLNCFRNDFMKHKIQFTYRLEDGNRKQVVAKWDHIEKFRSMEDPKFVYAPVLTNRHLRPNEKEKRKHLLATQVFSHQVAIGMYAKVAQKELPQDAIGTATLIYNISKLFDFMNTHTTELKRDGRYRNNMSSPSPHIHFVEEIKAIFKDMKFLGAPNPQSQEGWIKTLKATEKLFKNLKKYKINNLLVKRLSQEPLTKFFGSIRRNCGCNFNPSSRHFVGALKTTLISSVLNDNTELEFGSDLLCDLRKIVKHQS